jgi:cysteine desulfurase
MGIEPIYLDHAATSPIWPDVLEAMMPYLTSEYGNPSSVYGPGRRAKHTLEKCRGRVAELLGVGPAEIVFTSGGSESNNAVCRQYTDLVITSPVEHESVKESVKRLPSSGMVIMVSPDATGRISPESVETALYSDNRSSGGTGLASFMAVNNELGTINPIEEIGHVLARFGFRFHTDAVQAAGIMDLSHLATCVDYMTLSGHKLGGPKGVGALFVKAGAPWRSFIAGGSQEQERRAGTENVAGIVGFTRALERSVENRIASVKKMRELRDQLVGGLSSALSHQIRFNSPPGDLSSPHIINFVCLDDEGQGLDGEMLILGLDMAGVYVSAGSACSSGTMKASAVLTSLGMNEQVARGAIRISINPRTTKSEISEAIERINQTVSRMTGVSS